MLKFKKSVCNLKFSQISYNHEIVESWLLIGIYEPWFMRYVRHSKI